MMQMLLVIVLIIMVPFLLFFGIVGLAIFIWCWNRIGRYFVNFTRWLGSWRNFIPLSIIGILGLIFTVVIFPIVGLPAVVVAVLLILWVLVTVVIFLFALIAWTLEFSQWFWPRWRKLVWSGFVSIWGSLPARSGEGQRRRPKPPAEAPTQKRPPKKRSGFGNLWALMLGRPPQPAKSVASPQPDATRVQRSSEVAPPAKRSWFGTFWALMLGKPQPKRQQARPTRVQTTEQILGPSGSPPATRRSESHVSESASSAAPRARTAKPSKGSWFGSFWALMLGRPSKPSQRKAQPEKAKTVDRADHSTQTTAAADAKTGATARARAATSAEKPAKRGFSAGTWNSIVRGITFVAGLVVLAVLWVVQRVREGIEWIRVRLNLD